MKKLFVFGNEFLEEDNFAHKVAKHLPFQIQECSAPDELLTEKDICILDVVKNASEPMILGVDDLKTRKIFSLHDFDLSFFLQLMKEMDIKKKIKIIGIPQQGDSIAIAEQVKAWI